MMGGKEDLLEREIWRIEILRCFGIEGRAEIPGMIDGKVLSAGLYAFSSHMDEKEDLKCQSVGSVRWS